MGGGKKIAAAAAMLFALWAPQAVATEDPQFDNYDPDTIEPILDALNYKHERLESGSETFVKFYDEFGVMHGAFPRVCVSGPLTDCRGLLLFSVFPLDIPLEDINEFNRSIVTVSAVREGDFIMIRRYLIGDHGVSSKNIEQNLSTFVRSVSRYVAYRKSIAPQTKSVSNGIDAPRASVFIPVVQTGRNASSFPDEKVIRSVLNEFP